MKIAIGCDEAGVELKNILREHVKEKGHEVEDFGLESGESVLYPLIAEKVAESIIEGKNERGIIICGTGIGMAITANKLPGIRATVAHDVFSAQRSIMSNNCQIITMGQRVIGSESAKTIIDAWLESHFVDGNSTPKIQKMMEIEDKYRTVK
ncbi:ribose 5-phosphate isomerase B [Alkalibaculum sp. M08DMB]|uniref:Ribose 5-phosphate isomerase B n=1 Tax=Alkalibaculum sporogenes TaxID=2655001 RepID=A0A6A7KCM2_9FIRM|nr:ribose 5-phosphate isomerase B [Alkalibaculum sporogenes]MPW27280.1 ribose 5-phosphate isomerase B [Alkalibaculum sporogenes]